MTTPPDGYVVMAGLNVPTDVAPTLIAAIRSLYASQTAGLDDEQAIEAVTWATMADVLARYAVWSTTLITQVNLTAAQQALAAAQNDAQQRIAAAQLAAQVNAGRIVAPTATVHPADAGTAVGDVTVAAAVPLADTAAAADDVTT